MTGVANEPAGGSAGGSAAGSVGEAQAGGAGRAWVAATPEEAALLEAVRVRDQAAYLRVLAGVALVLPVTVASATGGEPLAWATAPAGDHTYLLVFTSLPAATAAGADVRAIRQSPSFDVLAAAGAAGWGLAVDPGLPVQLFLAPSAVPEVLAAEATFTPVEAALRAASAAGDREAYLRVLLDAMVVLPLAPAAQEQPGTGGPSRDLTDPDFGWWRTERRDGEPVVLGFTSLARMYAEVGERDWIEVSFRYLALSWPDRACGLRLNSGTSNGIELPGSAIGAIADALRGER